MVEDADEGSVGYCSSSCLRIITDVASVVCYSHDWLQLRKQKPKITVAKTRQKCILFHVKEAQRLAFPADVKSTPGSLVTRNASTPLLMASLFPPKVAAGATAFTSAHSPARKEISRSSQTPLLLMHLHLQLTCPPIPAAAESGKCINSSGDHVPT